MKLFLLFLFINGYCNFTPDELNDDAEPPVIVKSIGPKGTILSDKNNVIYSYPETYYFAQIIINGNIRAGDTLIKEKPVRNNGSVKTGEIDLTIIIISFIILILIITIILIFYIDKQKTFEKYMRQLFEIQDNRVSLSYQNTNTRLDGFALEYNHVMKKLVEKIDTMPQPLKPVEDKGKLNFINKKMQA